MKLSRMINFDMKINETSIFNFFCLVLLSVITEIVWKILTNTFCPFFLFNGKELKGLKFSKIISPSMWMVRICFILFDITSGRHWKESKILIFYFWFLFGIKFILASPIENRPEDALFAWNKVASSYINKYIDFWDDCFGWTIFIFKIYEWIKIQTNKSMVM